MTARLKPAENYDLREQVFQSIKEAITDGLFKPGEKLSETDLADRLNVSRTPVREAIRQLAKTGLVQLQARKGAFVTSPTREDASQLYALREHLEAYAVELVRHNPPLEELRYYRSWFMSMNSTTTKEDYLKADKEFHLMIYRASGNHYLEDTLRNLQDLINLYRPYSMVAEYSVPKLATEHIAVIDGLIHNKPDVSASMKHHIRHTFELISEALA